MAFESLSDKLQNVFKNLTRQGPTVSESRCKSRAQRSQDGPSGSGCKLQGSKTVYQVLYRNGRLEQTF